MEYLIRKDHKLGLEVFSVKSTSQSIQVMYIIIILLLLLWVISTLKLV